MVQQQLKQSVETGQRLRGDPEDSFVRVKELTQGGLWTLVNGVLVPGTIANAGGGAVVVTDSITGAGTTVSPLELSGDSAAPGNTMLYGTNGSGTKGWYTQPSGGSTTLAGLTDVLVSAPANGQVLTYISSASKWENQNIGTAANVTPDTHPASPNALDDEFESGTTINTSKWTAFALLTGTNAVAAGALKFLPALNGGTRNWGGYSQPAPGTAFTIVAKLAGFNGSSNTLNGLFFATASGASGHIVLFGWNGTTLIVQHLSNSTTFSSNAVVSGQTLTETLVGYPWTYLQIQYDGTNLNFAASLSGEPGSFVAIFSETAVSFLGGAPALIGLGSDNESSSVQSALYVDWFRRTA